jgi:hypothetical protein
MAMLWEKVVVTAREFLVKNINDSREYNEPITKAKLIQFSWEPQFAAASTMVEIVWKMAIGRENTRCWQQLDRLFSPSAIATHANFRGCRDYKTGNLPQKGAIAIWRRGNSWQGDIAIVSDVSEDKQTFDVLQGSSLNGSEEIFIQVVEKKGKHASLPFRSDKLNLIGFIYPPDREIA